MVTIREYKEFYARKITATAFQNHISQLKNNCWDTFYFYSLCRKSDRQFLVVQMHFWVSEYCDCSFCWNMYVKIHEKELGRSKLEQTLLKDCRQRSFYLSWPTLHTSQVYKEKGPNMTVNPKLQSTFIVFIHQASKKIYFQTDTVFLLVAYTSHQHLQHLYGHICMTNYCKGKLLLTPERVRAT